MTEEISQWARIKAVFLSGKVVPITGYYDFIGHFERTPCFITHTGNRLMLAEGDTFPRHGTCNRKVFWRLYKAIEGEEANEITNDEKV